MPKKTDVLLKINIIHSNCSAFSTSFKMDLFYSDYLQKLLSNTSP